MPEIVTKYPEVLIQELKDAKGKCGEDIQPQILKACPRDQFCSLPTGEICVYNLRDISAMTQVSTAEWHEAITGVPGMFSVSNLIVLVFLFGLGLVTGMILQKPHGK